MHPYIQDNIVAIATPPGESAVAVLRFSGKSLTKLYKAFTKKNPKKRYAQFSKIYHPESDLILDEAIIIYYKSPNSFTGEDVIEIFCHGAESIKKTIISASLKMGVRSAKRGEFSLRSFLNGKIDLVQAESISALISSKGNISAQASLDNLGGKLSIALNNIKNTVFELITTIESELNFSEHEIEPMKISKIHNIITLIKKDIEALLSSSVFGKNIFYGLKVLLYGKPNSGKSTLFNAILGHERSIISKTAGTTRDFIEFWFELEGMPICLVDTAGVWKPKNNLDMEAVNKTYDQLKTADICIIIDEKNPFDLQNEFFDTKFKKHCIFVQSKSDLIKPGFSSAKNCIPVSSKKNIGIKNLLTSLSTHIKKDYAYDSSSPLLITDRQRIILSSSCNQLDMAIKGLDRSLSMDIVASLLRDFIYSLEEVVGTVSNKDVLDKIFNTFCIGK